MTIQPPDDTLRVVEPSIAPDEEHPERIVSIASSGLSAGVEWGWSDPNGKLSPDDYGSVASILASLLIDERSSLRLSPLHSERSPFETA
jgi:hypothetical protein